MRFWLQQGEESYEVEVERHGEDRWRVLVNGEPIEVETESGGSGHLRLMTENGATGARVTWMDRQVFVTVNGRDYRFEQSRASAGRSRRHEHPEGEISMPMPGVVIGISVEEGEQVTRGQPLLVVEAMKMEHTLRAPRDGKVANLAVQTGQMVDAGLVLLEVLA